jgi:sterol desaturase/sphingolipid hydroxylase (fatty acid hydroxylase superfamily)
MSIMKYAPLATRIQEATARGLTIRGVLATLVLSVVVAELFGYALHRLMHSERVQFISRAHLIHHLQRYGPDQAMRAAVYKDATDGRAALGNIGMEWLAPSGAILAICWMVLWRTGVAWAYQALALATLLGWPVFMFSYLHDRMHLEKFWMARTPVVKIWFRRARRFHDVHHRSLSDEGRMNRNFGIGFFFFDAAFGTLAKRHRPMNWQGYHLALRRHNLDVNHTSTRFPEARGPRVVFPASSLQFLGAAPESKSNTTKCGDANAV